MSRVTPDPWLLAGAVTTGTACLVAGGAWVHRQPWWPARPRTRTPDLPTDGEEIELSLSPRTRTLLPAPNPAPRTVDRDGPAPVARMVTSGAALTDEGAPVLAEVGTHIAPMPRTLGLDAGRRAELIAAAWSERDVEALAAQGAVDEASRLAALVLAGVLGREVGDPRAGHWLYQAFLTGAEPATCPLLAPFADDLRLPTRLPAWGIDLTFPATREGLGLTVAAEEVATGDLDSAYGVLLDLPTSPAVAALRGVVAVELQWWPRALRSVRATAELGPWSAVGRYVQARALTHSSAWLNAAAALDEALDLLDDPAAIGGATLRARCQFARAAARRELGDSDGAWADLTALMAAAPAYPGAAEALKAL